MKTCRVTIFHAITGRFPPTVTLSLRYMENTIWVKEDATVECIITVTDPSIQDRNYRIALEESKCSVDGEVGIGEMTKSGNCIVENSSGGAAVSQPRTDLKRTLRLRSKPRNYSILYDGGHGTLSYNEFHAVT